MTQDRDEDGKPLVAHYQSTDLSAWRRQQQPFLAAGTMGACPHLFTWNDWYYFAMGNRLWQAHSLAGPWQEQHPAPLAGLNYPKTAPFTGNRLLAAGWIGHAGWGGDLLFRELVQFADGGLGTRVPARDDPADRAAAAAGPRIPARRDELAGRPPAADGGRRAGSGRTRGAGSG